MYQVTLWANASLFVFSALLCLSLSRVARYTPLLHAQNRSKILLK